MIDQLLEPYHFEFFRNGLLVATIAGGLCGLIGVFVVQRGMSYIGHGLAHAIFGGFAASALLGLNYFIGARTLGNHVRARDQRRHPRSTASARTPRSASSRPHRSRSGSRCSPCSGRGASFDAALFGSILGVSRQDVAAILIVATVAVIVVFVFYRRFSSRRSILRSPTHPVCARPASKRC